ncbi:MAG: recombination mediator RecR [Thermodesulfobacteriota bacterium]|jgi:recombination protein RecR|nr:MAG: recombination mediator RecR [Thermodesulfobacteriota bacterium]
MIAEALNRLVRELTKLPSIGEKTALRMAFHIISLPRSEAQSLAQSIIEIKEKVTLCSVCFNITDCNPCSICESDRSNSDTICVVESPAHLAAFERTGQFKGIYHVLQGVISPLRNTSPDDLKIKELVTRLQQGKVKEVILAMNPTREGETTAIYLANIIKPLSLKVTRIAQGIPRGGEIEYLDESTLKSSLEGRREL